MADIDVVRKRRTSLWVWVIAAILVAVVLFFLFPMGGDQTRPVSRLIGPSLTLRTTVAV
jgi:bacteriorhodopsin